MSHTFFRVPDWRAAMLSPDLRAAGPAVPLPLRLAPPISLVKEARRLAPTDSALWVPDRAARAAEVVAENGQTISPSGPEAWVFFCDDAPGTGWGHDCRYFVMRVGELPLIVDASAPPRERVGGIGFVEDRPARRFL